MQAWQDDERALTRHDHRRLQGFVRPEDGGHVAAARRGPIEALSHGHSSRSRRSFSAEELS